jgi:hypothetical protein
MTQPSSLATPVAPKQELLRGTLIAAALASVILTVVVLPAEYGIDPIGAGRALGLASLHQGQATTVSASPVAPAIPAKKGSTVSAPGEVRGVTVASPQTVAYRTDVMEVTLAPGKGLEVKTHLAKGATLVYSWKTVSGAVVNHDFHGEPVNAGKDEFESFILENGVSKSSGSLVAPFTGVHGWYWKNKSGAPVTIELQASGFYSDIFKK